MGFYTMANADHLLIFERGTEAWNNWRSGDQDIQPDLSEATLGVTHHHPTLDLQGVNFQHANLIGADLAETRLCEANLQGVDLREARLCYADLSGANLQHADLRNANLSKVKLINTDLSEADLRGAHLDGADLTGANLTGAMLNWFWLHETSVKGLNLTGVRFCQDVEQDLFL